jgi:predicted metal-dependent peptidase
MDYATKVEAARLLVIAHPDRGRPYYAHALMALSRPVVVDGGTLPTIGVDYRWRLYVNPDFVESISVDKLAVALVHEVNHLLRDHHARAHGLSIDADDATRWNLAADAEINQDLVADGLPLPDWAVLPAGLNQPDRLTAEEYYERLPRSALWSTDLGAGPLGGGRPTGDCGSCAGGSRRNHELATATEADAPEPGIDPSHAAAVRRRVASDVVDHSRSGGRGSVPAGLRRWAEDLLEPKVDWRRVLAGLVRNAVASARGKVDYTYRYGSRRTTGEMIFPALRAPEHSVAVIVDTSGSMAIEDLEAALAEVDGILRAAGCDDRSVRVLSADTTVHAVRRVTSTQQIDLVGGGGTDMASAIATADRLRPPPTAIVVLTDGETPWPSRPGRAPVVAGLIVPPGRTTPKIPEWITSVRIGDTAGPSDG